MMEIDKQSSILTVCAGPATTLSIVGSLAMSALTCRGTKEFAS